MDLVRCYGNRYKMLATETSLPLPWKQLSGMEKAFTKLQSTQPDRSAAGILWSQARLNPFTTNLFPRSHRGAGEYPVDARGFANAVFLRNQTNRISSEGMRDVFPTYMRSGCVLSHISAENVPLPLPISYPKFFRGVDEVSLSQNDRLVAVDCNASI